MSHSSAGEEDSLMNDMPGSFGDTSRRAGKKRRGEESSDETPYTVPTELQIPQSVLNIITSGPSQSGPQPAQPSFYLSSRTSKIVEERRMGKLKNDLRFRNIVRSPTSPRGPLTNIRLLTTPVLGAGTNGRRKCMVFLLDIV